MNKHHDQALQFLHKAEQDTLAVSRFSTDPDIAAEILGFHAQQAAEKTMKAVLAELQVTFPYTHRLKDLIDLLANNGQPLPQTLTGIGSLTRFAVQFRYDYYQDTQGDPFDAPATLVLLARLRAWAEQIVNPPSE